MIQKPQARGQELMAAWLSNELIDQGDEVLLVSLYDGEFPLDFKGEHLSLKLQSSIDPFLPRSWTKVNTIIKEFKPDVVQANGGDTLKLMALSRVDYAFPVHYVFNNGGILSFYLKGWLKKNLYKWFLKNLDAAVAVCEFGLSDMERYLPLEMKRLSIPIGLNIENDSNCAPSRSNQIFIHIGGFSKEKNHLELLRIFKSYSEIDSHSELWLIGEGEMIKEVRDEVQKMHLKNVKFLGSKTNPWLLVPENAILLLTSVIEGTPAVLLEASVRDIPSVSYSVGGIPELMNRIKLCHLIKSGDSNLFLQKMRSLANENSPQYQRKDREESLNFIKENYSISKIAGRWRDLYKELCA